MWGPKRLATPDDLSRSARQLITGLGEGWKHKVEFAKKATVAKKKIDGDFEIVQHEAHYVVVHMRHPDAKVGAFAMFVDGKYTIGSTWTICADPDCDKGTAEHPANMPRFGVPFRELAVITSDVPVLTEEPEVIPP